MMPQDREGSARGGSAGSSLAPVAASRPLDVPSAVSEDPLLRAAAAISDPSPSELRALASGRTRTALCAGEVVAKRYRLDRELGRGGMGVVWEAAHLITRRRVAIKFVLGPEHVHEDLRRRFYREARAASAANHPNVVEVLDVFELDDGTPVMVMELLSGETLRETLVREGRLSIGVTASILLPVVAAVGTAHALGIVHRDLKPENVFLCKGAQQGTAIKVLDFGVAKLTAPVGEASETASITGTGSTLGTPCYMAPEQATGERDVDARADVWALGVIVYECLAGSRPVEGSGIGQVVMKLMTDGIKPLDQVVQGLPPDITALVMRMLARERGDRPRDLREVEGVLARYGPSAPPTVDTQSPRSVSSVGRLAPRRSVIVASAASAVAFAGFLGSRTMGSAPASSSRPVREVASVSTPPAPLALAPHQVAEPPMTAALPTPAAGSIQPAEDGPGAERPVRVDIPRRKVGAAAVASAKPVPAAAAPLPRAVDTASAEPDPGGLVEKPPF